MCVCIVTMQIESGGAPSEKAFFLLHRSPSHAACCSLPARRRLAGVRTQREIVKEEGLRKPAASCIGKGEPAGINRREEPRERDPSQYGRNDFPPGLGQAELRGKKWSRKLKKEKRNMRRCLFLVPVLSVLLSTASAQRRYQGKKEGFVRGQSRSLFERTLFSSVSCRP